MWRKWRACDTGEAKEGLENELWRWWSNGMSSAHSPTYRSLHLRHSSFSNLSVALPTPQLILQPFRCLTNVTAHSPTLLSLLLCHRFFTYVTWRTAHVMNIVLSFFVLAQGKHLRPFLYLQWYSRKQQILPHPSTPFKYFRGKVLLTRQTDYSPGWL